MSLNVVCKNLKQKNKRSYKTIRVTLTALYLSWWKNPWNISQPKSVCEGQALAAQWSMQCGLGKERSTTGGRRREGIWGVGVGGLDKRQTTNTQTVIKHRAPVIPHPEWREVVSGPRSRLLWQQRKKQHSFKCVGVLGNSHCLHVLSVCFKQNDQ